MHSSLIKNLCPHGSSKRQNPKETSKRNDQGASTWMNTYTLAHLEVQLVRSLTASYGMQSTRVRGGKLSPGTCHSMVVTSGIRLVFSPINTDAMACVHILRLPPDPLLTLPDAVGGWSLWSVPTRGPWPLAYDWLWQGWVGGKHWSSLLGWGLAATSLRLSLPASSSSPGSQNHSFPLHPLGRGPGSPRLLDQGCFTRPHWFPLTLPWVL